MLLRVDAEAFENERLSRTTPDSQVGRADAFFFSRGEGAVGKDRVAPFVENHEVGSQLRAVAKPVTEYGIDSELEQLVAFFHSHTKSDSLASCGTGA